MIVTILTSSIAALFLGSIWYYWKSIAPYSGFPSISGLFLVTYNFLTGKIPKTTPVTHFYFQALTQHLKKFESEGLCVLWLLKPYLFVFGEEAVKIFSKEASALNKPPVYEVMHDLFGEGLITCNGDEWNQRRKMLNPVFHVRMLKSKANILNKNAAALVKTLMNVEDKSSLTLLKYLGYCFISNLSEFVLGIQVDDPKRSSDVKRLIDIVEKSTEVVIYRFVHPWLRSRHALKFFSKGREYLNIVKEIFKTAEKILQDTKDSIASRNSTAEFKEMDDEFYGSSPRKSFAEILMEYHQKDPSYSVKDMVYETMTFILAGYETVAVASMWCIFELGHHPEMQEIVYNEVEGLEEIAYDDLGRLKYLECVILETLRIHSVVPFYARKLDKNIQCGKYDVPIGTTIVFAPYLYHRNPNVYTEPEEFDPERFLNENSEKRPWTHIPFSEGIRNCIGKKFALMEMKIVLAHIVRSFKLTSLDRREDIQLNWQLTLNPVKPLRTRLTPRH